MKIFSLLACVIIALVCSCHGAKILVLFSLPGKSHSIMLNRLLEGLLDRGHELDVVSCFPLQRSSPNYTSIELPIVNIWTKVQQAINVKSIYEMPDMSYNQTANLYFTMGLFTTDYALAHPAVQQLIHNPHPKKYELVLVEQFYQEAFLMLAHQLGAPIVSVNSQGYESYFSEMFGSFTPWAHVPHEWITLSQRMTFWERVRNVHRYLEDRYRRTYDYMPQQQQMADKYFAHLPEPKPSLEELTRRVSVILMNMHAPLSDIRPLMPGLVDVGGLHIDEPRPLPADIAEFLDGAADGAIFFALGTQVQSADMPKEQLNAFLRVLGRLKQRVLWKFEADALDAAVFPANMMVRKWMPQSDILAHPKVRLFITHGGLLGTLEAVKYGVPMLAFPFYTDQHPNTLKTSEAGYAIKMQFSNITETSLTWAVEELLQNPEYAVQAKKAAKIFNDRPLSALDTATYWIEYVIRFNGTEHLRSAAFDLSWASYFLLDIIGAALVAVVISLIALWFVAKWLIRIVSKTNTEKKNN